MQIVGSFSKISLATPSSDEKSSCLKKCVPLDSRYGDKSPRSVPARVFAVLWILIGITTFSLVTAMLSSELTKASALPVPQIEGSYH